MILEEFTHQKNPGWASCAAVCKEWQIFIEERNFRRLKLRESCLDEFKHMVVRQRHLVRHIQFNIQLPGHLVFTNLPAVPGIEPRQSLVIDKFQKLATILGTWKKTGDITVELNVYTPADSKHWSKELFFKL